MWSNEELYFDDKIQSGLSVGRLSISITVAMASLYFPVNFHITYILTAPHKEIVENTEIF